MRTDNSKTVYLKNYRIPDYLIEHTDLRFDLEPSATLVRARLRIQRNPQAENPRGELHLDGENLELIALSSNGSPLSSAEYRLEDPGLVIFDPGESCTLEIITRIHPDTNTALEGLYQSGDFLLTQCEAQGFRKITYYLDRPDVMARFRVKLVADRQRYPVLLSNGNCLQTGDLDDGRHFAVWEDPYPKPSYLFALVAGDLGHLEGRFETADQRSITLRIYAEHHNVAHCAFALDSLINAMRWDEKRFGLSYDLDVFNVVVTDDFNMGAMENKSLNIFNSRYVLASPDTASDSDYMAIEGVIGHEYFHNWTGDRVTCRDWFQLTLKEGLTVFRDQEFSADMRSPAVKRIQDVRRLREIQFAEDAGPMSHPVRPDRYLEINNFYTATVYEKGAEVVRMVHTLLGETGFQAGMRLYVERHDGCAVSCEDFRAAMADANGRDLEQFGRWYSTPGTPVLHIDEHYDAKSQRYTLCFKQRSQSPDPLLIPIAVGLLDSDGADLPLQRPAQTDSGATTHILELTDARQEFVFESVPCKPVASILRGFSAPVRLDFAQGEADLAFLMAHDSDPFNRWEASNRLANRVLLGLVDAVAGEQALQLNPVFTDAFAATLDDDELDNGLKSEALTLPATSYLMDQLQAVDPQCVAAARDFAVATLARQNSERWFALYQRLTESAREGMSAKAMLNRRLRNLALDYLAALDRADAQKCVARQFHRATNMTDQIAALNAMVRYRHPQAKQALECFEQQWQAQPLVLDKWFAVQAQAPGDGAADAVAALMRHPRFSLRNPNRVRALIGAFAHRNPTGFHRPDGAGYVLLADVVLELDRSNPQIGSRMVSAFNSWRRFEPGRRAKMHAQLERIAATPGLSPDVTEIVTRALAAPAGGSGTTPDPESESKQIDKQV